MYSGDFASTDADAVLTHAQREFAADFEICRRVFVVDAHLAMSSEFKALRAQLSDAKERIARVSL